MPTRCAAYRCPESAGVTGLCKRHERRLQSEGTLPTANEPTVGDASGFGTFGVLDVDDAGILCHECGQRFVHLGSHVSRTYAISADDYRRRHGIEGSLALPPGSTPKRRPHPCSRCGTTLITPAKLCDECRAKRQTARQTKTDRQPRWRAMTDAEREGLAAAGPDDVAEIVAELQHGRVASKTIGQVLGLSAKQMTAQYPRPEWGREDPV